MSKSGHKSIYKSIRKPLAGPTIKFKSKKDLNNDKIEEDWELDDYYRFKRRSITKR